MANVNTSIHAQGGGGTSVTSGSVSPGGSNRVVVSVDISDQGYSTDAKFGGSGGTSLGSSIASGLADSTIGAGSVNVRRYIAVPSGSTTMYSEWGGATISASGSYLFLDGADQTTPLTALTQTANVGAGATSCSTGALSGLNPGQLVIAAVAAHGVFGGNVNSITSGNGSTTVYSPGYGTLSSGITDACAWMTGVADGSGNLTLTATVNEASATLFGWRVIPFAVNDASGGGGSTGTVNTTNANDTSSASGSPVVNGSLAHTNANDISNASGTTTITGTLARTNQNDALAASGSVGATVAGTLSVTNQNDTLVASGTTSVRGAGSAVNNNDTSTSSGTSTILGSLAYTNRSDTLSAFGFPGTLTITNIWRKLTVSARNSL